MEQIRMLYSAYKKHYPDCETVRGSYDSESKSIIVIIPDGRMKSSGVRGKRFMWLHYDGVEIATGRAVSTMIKATSRENAEKQLAKYYSDCIWNLEK